MKLFVSLLVIVLGSASSIILARADTYVGAMVGPSFLNNNYGTDVVFGGDVGFKIRPDLAVGVYATHETLNTNTNVGETTLAAEVNFFPPEGRPFYLGAKAGAGFLTNSFLNSSGSEIDFIFGPAVGFKVPVFSPSFDAGMEANALFLESANTDIFVNVIGTVSFHF